MKAASQLIFSNSHRFIELCRKFSNSQILDKIKENQHSREPWQITTVGS